MKALTKTQRTKEERKETTKRKKKKINKKVSLPIRKDRNTSRLIGQR
jgi:hypothetical protein